MLKASLAIISLLVSFHSWGAATVRLNDSTTPVVKATRTTTYSLVVDSPSGDGTSKSAPARVYVPIHANGGTGNKDYNQFSNGSNNVLLAGADGQGSLIFSLDLNEDSENVDFYIGVEESDGDFSIVDNVNLAPSQGNDIDVTVELNDICTADSNGSDTLDCDNKFLEADDPVSQKSVIIYLFYGAPGLTGNGVDLSSVATGVYYELKLSNKVSTGTITLSSLLKGDAQLTAVYAGPSLADLYKVEAFDYTTASHEDETYSAATTAGGKVYATSETATTGSAKIKNLVNDRTYNFSIFFTDKYNFSTLFSNDESGTPQQIEALLKKNSCFLLTAGFGGDHPIIDYFRKFRDETLSKTSFGKSFIKLYYAWGPKLAPYVLENPWLAKSIRVGAAAGHWVMQTRFWLVLLVFLMGLFLGTLMLVLNRREGEMVPWQVTVNSPTSNTEKALKTQNVEKSFPNS